MTTLRSKRLEARIKPEVLVLVKRAAEMLGTSVSEFVVAAAEEAARKALAESFTLQLSVEDQRRFVELLLDPPAPNDALRRAHKAHEDLLGPL